MPRHPRHEDHGATHHVVLQGNGRRVIVRDDRDRTVLVERFLAMARRHDWTVHAWSLLDTHVHAVLTTPEPTLGHGVGRLLGAYAAWHNARHRASGAVFAERFWSRRAEAHLVRACVYTLVNPVAAGVVEHPSAWRWSSYDATVRDGCSALIRDTVGGTAELLRFVDEAAHWLIARRPAPGGETWRGLAPLMEARG